MLMKIDLSVLCWCVVALFSACASSPASGGNTAGNTGASPAEAQAAAQAALNRMDGGRQPAQPAQPGSTQSAQPAQPAQSGAVVNTSRSKPAWVDSVDSVYGKAQYVAAVGYAADRAM